MRILITGGNGFIGRNLIEILSIKHEIEVIDMHDEPFFKNVKYHKLSFTDSELLPKILKNIDAVIHLAAILGVDKCENDPKSTLLINGINACNFFELCKRSEVKKLIFSSSSEVYGDVEHANEDTKVCPKSDYGIAKLFAERYLNAISNKGFKTFSLRLFSVYGKGQSKEFVIPKFINQAKNKQKITLYGDGSQMRAFCHVKDICQGFIKCLESENNQNATLLNIGNNNEPIKIKDLAYKILSLYNLEPKNYIIETPLKNTKRGIKREIYFRSPSIKTAQDLLGYEPKVDLEMGLSLMD